MSESQLNSLSLGRKKGTNNRGGFKHAAETREKCSESHKKWCAENPERVKARGEKTRGEKHYKWKGGASTLNSAIRRMTEYRKWSDAVKARDGQCVKCGSLLDLESHHLEPLAAIIGKHGISCTADARMCKELWDTSNGETVCQKCHCIEHDREYTPPFQSVRYQPSLKRTRRSFSGNQNPRWKGGKSSKACLLCGTIFSDKQGSIAKRKFCSRKCQHENKRKSVQQNAASPSGDVR